MNENETAEDRYEGWTILELMGHRRIIGYVKEQEIAGRVFLRVDIPAEPPVTQFYGAEAVYCMTPTTEEVARRACRLNRIEPVHRWELPAPASTAADPADDDAETGDPDGVDAWNQPLALEDVPVGTRL